MRAPVENRPFLTATWRHLAILNFSVEPDILQPFVPAGTSVDTYKGRAYLSLIGFLFLKTKVMGVPLLFHQQFEEVNLRFYVRRFSGEEWRRGVVFIKEIVPAALISAAARFFYNENYMACPMRHTMELTGDGTKLEYAWQINNKWNRLNVASRGRPEPIRAGTFEEFIVHHEWGYTRQRDGRCLEYRVVHPVWDVARATECSVEADANGLYGEPFGGILAKPPDSAFTVSGSEVEVYRGKRLNPLVSG